ncbi:MAG: hypothetical protein PHG79_11505 [Methanosarcina sp.]|nr:hypothetical protein [Methanosarcina sp.]
MKGAVTVRAQVKLSYSEEQLLQRTLKESRPRSRKYRAAEKR